MVFSCFLEPCTYGFVLAAALLVLGWVLPGFRQFRCFAPHVIRLRQYSGLALGKKQQNLLLKSFAPVVFAYNKRLPSSWNFYSVGRNMDELGNFGHVSVPIMEGPGHCLRLKNGAFFLDYDWFSRSALWRVVLQIFIFSERPILHYYWEVPMVPFIVHFFSCGSPIYFSDSLVDCS